MASPPPPPGGCFGHHSHQPPAYPTYPPYCYPVHYPPNARHVPGVVNTNKLPRGMSVGEAVDISDFDRLMRHQDFREVLMAAARVKVIDGAPPPGPGILNLAAGVGQADKAAKIVRENVSNNSSLGSQLPRGLFPHTDLLIDVTMDSLTRDFEARLSILGGAVGYSSNGSGDLSGSGSDEEYVPPAKKARQRKGRDSPSQAIAVKYSKGQTDILTEWMIVNRAHPFPAPEQIKALSGATGLSYSQVVNWTTNVRKRNLKATVERGKKPHHFLDFLFLAEDRENKGEEKSTPLTALASVKKSCSASARGRQATKNPKSTCRRSRSKTKSTRGRKLNERQKKKELPMQVPSALYPSLPIGRELPPLSGGGVPPPRLPLRAQRGIAPYTDATRPFFPGPFYSGGRMNAPHTVYPPYYSHVYHPCDTRHSPQRPIHHEGDARTITPSNNAGFPTRDQEPNMGDAIITPSSSSSLTGHVKRDSIALIAEALDFWDNDLLSVEDMSNDAAFCSVRGLVGDRAEHGRMWHQQYKSNNSNGNRTGRHPQQRSSITEAAALPEARNEVPCRMFERRLSGVASTLAAYGAEWEPLPASLSATLTASAAKPDGRSASLTVQDIEDAVMTPMPLDDEGIFLEFLEESAVSV